MKVIVLFLCCVLTLMAHPIKNSFAKAQEGDYVVFEEGKHLFLFVIRQTSPLLIIEEFAIPSDQKKSISDWKKWARNQEPPASSHLLYEMDVERNRITECFSLTKGAFLKTNQESLFFKLFHVPFSKLKKNQRKKIGPPPMDGEMDLRSLWNPPVHYEAKTITPQYTVYSGRWPKDGSDFENATLEIYYAMQHPFPFWLEISNHSLRKFIQAVDAGKNFPKTYAFFPRRRPQLIMQKGSMLKVHIPHYYLPFKLVRQTDSQTIPYEIKKIAPETFMIHVQNECNDPLLLEPENYPHLKSLLL
jgi:hypothetical protein